MDRNITKKSRAWFWSGVALLSISAVFWLAGIVTIATEPQNVIDMLLGTLIITAIPLGIGIYGVFHGREVYATGLSRRQEGWREFSQSRAAVWAAVGIIFLNAIFVIVDAVIYREMPGAQVFGTNVPLVSAFAVDLFLAINLLRGKRWARTWMLIRLIIGLLAWGIISIVQGYFGDLIMQFGHFGAILLLLTGTSTGKRVAGSIALYIILLVVGASL